MCRATSTIRFVDVLATCSLSAHKVQTHLLHVHSELPWNLWHDKYNSRARVDPSLLLRFWDSLHLVHSRFVLQVLIDVLSGNFDDTLFDPSVNAHILLQLKLLEPKAHHAAIALVHLEQILSKEAAFRAAGSLKDLKCAVTLVSIALRQYNIDDLFCVLIELLL